MRIMSTLSVLTVVLAVSQSVIAHPHLVKRLIVQVNGVEAELRYFTAPANEEHVASVETGAFTPSWAEITLSAQLSDDGHTIPAGRYTIGAIKQAEDDWTLALHPALQEGETPEPSQIIRLDSSFSTSRGAAEHVYFDIAPGSGALAGKTVLVWHYGSLYLAGSLR